MIPASFPLSKKVADKCNDVSDIFALMTFQDSVQLLVS